jgi:DNA-binding CsgD family transcriptional regulator
MDLLEREAALGAITAVLEGARAGSGGALFIVGEAGLGKTSLLAAACAAARAAGMDVAQGRGEPMEQAVAFGLAGQVLGSVGVAGLVATGPRPVAEPTVPFHRVLRWLEGRSRRPLLIAADDLHWADADSLGLFGFVARRLARVPVALVGTMRPWPEEPHGLARVLHDAGEARVERLAPLSEASSGDLMAARVGADLPAGTRRRAFELTGGNPLLTEQLAGALARGEWAPDAGGPALPALAQTLLLARFAGLDEAGLACIRAGSVLGTTWGPDVACEMAGIEEAAIDTTLAALVGSGLVTDVGGGRVRFVHPLFAQALYDDLPSPLRRRLHARAFRALSARRLDGEAAQHAEHAALHGDGEALALLERAGRAALSAGATITAVRNLEVAVRFAGARASVGLLTALAEALSAAGRATDAARVCDRLLGERALPWPERVEVLRMQGRALYMTAARDRGEAAFAEAARVARRHDRHRAVQPLVDLSLAVWLADGPRRALPIAVRARELAGDGPAELRLRADATWGHIALEAGDPRGLEATEPIGRSVHGPEAARLLDPVELAWPWAPLFQYAMSCNYLDRHDEAEAVFRLAHDVLERAGAANASATVAIHIANSAIRGGRLHDALAAADRAADLAELTPGVRGYAHLARADALAWLGRLEESEHECARAEVVAGGEWFVRLWLAHVRGMRLLWQGDPAAATVLAEAEDVTRAVGIREPCHVHWWNHAVAAYLGVGDLGRAEALVAWAAELAAPLPCRWPSIVATYGRAQVAARAGDHRAAEAAFREALDLHDRVGFPLDRVEVLLAYGGFLRRRGRLADARRPLGEALGDAEAAGAGFLARLAAEELRLAGGRRRRRGDATRLTPAQERVAALAAEGLSNAEIARRLFVSVNTVEAHLRQIFQKLGVSSRRALILQRRGTDR